MATNPIVVGHDGSTVAQHALEWAAGHARDMDAPIHLVAAYEAPVVTGIDGGVLPIDTTTDELTDRALAAVGTAIADAGIDPDRASITAHEGPPGRVLVEVAEAEDARLLVVGTRGLSTLVQVLLGSVSRYVATHAPCPVAVVPAGDDRGPDAPVVVGVDGSAGSVAALRWAYAHTSAPIMAIHAWDVPSFYGVPLRSANVMAEASILLVEDAVRRAGLEDDPRVDHRSERGDPRSVLLDDDPAPSLIVIGSHGHTTFKERILGTVAAHVATHAPVPVVITGVPD